MKCSRKKYFSDKLLETKGDVNGTWKVLNSALGKRSKTTQTSSLVIDNQKITNPEDIVTNLNKHFTNIAEKPSKNQNKTTAELKNFIAFQTTLPSYLGLVNDFVSLKFQILVLSMQFQG